MCWNQCAQQTVAQLSNAFQSFRKTKQMIQSVHECNNSSLAILRNKSRWSQPFASFQMRNRISQLGISLVLGVDSFVRACRTRCALLVWYTVELFLPTGISRKVQFLPRCGIGSLEPLQYATDPILKLRPMYEDAVGKGTYILVLDASDKQVFRIVAN